MHLHYTLAALLLASTPSCNSVTPDAPSKAAIQLAQYPGAPLEDRNGNFWFSTVQEGLIRYDGKEFVTFTMEDGLAGNTVRDIVEDDEGVLWIATTGGVSKYDGKTFTTLVEYGVLSVTYSFSEEGNHRDIWDIFIDRWGDMWVASMDGVFRYDGEILAPFPLPVIGTAETSEFTPKMVYIIFEDSDGVLWFGTDGAGAVSYDGATMKVYTEKGDGLCSDRICEIREDSRGIMWFGTSGGGVSQYKDGTFTTHLRSSTFSRHTGWGRFMAIHEDAAGTVWFGSTMSGGGVYRYDGKSFQYLSKEEGLGEGGIPSISEDRSGTLWFGTTSGVFRFDGQKFINFTRSD
jgi:ligand-binding sensor domain-containing protein